jgi:hypothetical protein
VSALKTYPVTPLPWTGTTAELLSSPDLGFYCWAHKQRTGEWPDQLEAPMGTAGSTKELGPNSLGVHRVDVFGHPLVLRIKVLLYRLPNDGIVPPHRLSTVTGDSW